MGSFSFLRVYCCFYGRSRRNWSTRQKIQLIHPGGASLTRTDTENSSPPRPVWLGTGRTLQELGKWRSRRAAWHRTGQGATREPCAGSMAREAGPVGAALCDPASLKFCGGCWGKTSGSPCLESQTSTSTLSCYHLSSCPCPTAQQGPGTTGTLRNIGEMSLSRLVTPGLKSTTASSG